MDYNHIEILSTTSYFSYLTLIICVIAIIPFMFLLWTSLFMRSNITSFVVFILSSTVVIVLSLFMYNLVVMNTTVYEIRTDNPDLLKGDGCTIVKRTGDIYKVMDCDWDKDDIKHIFGQ